jgi:hypothetical protein
MGSAKFDLQYQNDPSGMGGNIFKREFYRYVDRVPEGSRTVGVDLAIGANQRSDYTTCVEAVEDDQHNLYITAAWRERLEDGHRQWLTGLNDDGTRATGPALTGPRLLWPLDQLPSGFAGAYGTWASPRRFTSVNNEQEQISFPNGEHDDLVDAAIYTADVGGNDFSFTSASW